MIKIDSVLEGRISMNGSGSGYFIDEKLPRDIYIHKNNTNHALHLDTVKIKVIKGVDRQFEGVVLEVVSRFKTNFVGTLQLSDKFGFFIPDSNKMPVDIFIPLTKINGALDGQKVVAKIVSWPKNKPTPNGEILEILGFAGDNDTEIHSILHEYDLPYNFNEDVIAEAETISPEIKESEIAERRDMRNTLTLTIDPKDAKDFDDALSVRWVDGVLEVGVHIADVSHYLRPDTDLDKEAYKRGTSVYLVDRVVPMLPERLSNGLCSLRPNEDKLCFSIVFTLDNNGSIINEWVGRTIINSNRRYTYEEAQEAIEGTHKKSRSMGISTSVNPDFLYDQAVRDLDRYAKILRKNRVADGSISFEKGEVKFELDAQSKPIRISFKTIKDSNKLIEEFMLLANRRIAYLLNWNQYPVINRVHEQPLQERLLNLKKFINQFGYELSIKTPKEVIKSLNKLLADTKGTPEEGVISTLVVRTMQKAYYSTKNLGHYGLEFDDYCHFTSPIRRYPDVMVHRLLSRFLTNKPVPKIDKLESKCVYLSERERKAQKAERDSIKYMQCLYMSDKVGNIFDGIVTSVTEYGIFVEVCENKVDGLVRLSDITSDRFISDMENYCVRGQESGRVIRLGDIIKIVVTAIDIERKVINFTMILD
jgi:ribonuclease R